MMQFLLVFLALCSQIVLAKRPHIVVMVIDDLGWNDVSFHGSKQIPTPSIDKLAEDGLPLENYYVNPVCSPTRSSLWSGRSIVSTGIYMPLEDGQNSGLNQSCNLATSQHCRLLPEILEPMGYRRVLIGKWHIGFFSWAQTPLERGFESYFGYLGGAEDYFTHFSGNGLDFWNMTSPDWNYNESYSTWVFRDKVVSTIESHDPSTPLFLGVTFQATHSPLEAPIECIAPFNSTITNLDRRTFAGMDRCMDMAVGDILQALDDAGMRDDTIIFLTSDNGGPANFNENMANNLPLLGRKHTVYEGGVRVAGVVAGAGVQGGAGVENWNMLHVSDVYFALAEAAMQGINGSEVNSAGSIAAMNLLEDQPAFSSADGVWAWDSLRGAQGAISNRTEIIWYAVDDRVAPGANNSGAIRVGHMKYIRGDLPWGLNDTTGREWIPVPNEPMNTSEFTVQCQGVQPANACDPAIWPGCLFNITRDPCEYHNLAASYPDLIEELGARIDKYAAIASIDYSNPINSKECLPTKANNFTWTPCEGIKEERDGGVRGME